MQCSIYCCKEVCRYQSEQFSVSIIRSCKGLQRPLLQCDRKASYHQRSSCLAWIRGSTCSCSSKVNMKVQASCWLCYRRQLWEATWRIPAEMNFAVSHRRPGNTTFSISSCTDVLPLRCPSMIQGDWLTSLHYIQVSDEALMIRQCSTENHAGCYFLVYCHFVSDSIYFGVYK